MKFKTQTDELQYNILRLDEIELRKRILVVTKAKDRKRSRSMKDRWRRNKATLKKGIDKWHKSTAGKRFHRALGRFNALRETAGYQYYYRSSESPIVNNEKKSISMSKVNDALLSLSSIETHLNIELQYYEPDPEAMAQFIEIVEMFHKDANHLRTVLMQSFTSGEILVEDYMLLNDIIQFFQDPKMYLYAKRELEGFSNDSETIDFVEQKSFVESTNFIKPGNEIYDAIDALIVK